MATLSLKISVVGSSVVKTMQFDPSTIVFDACRIVRDRIPEANIGNGERQLLGCQRLSRRRHLASEGTGYVPCVVFVGITPKRMNEAKF